MASADARCSLRRLLFSSSSSSSSSSFRPHAAAVADWNPLIASPPPPLPRGKKKGLAAAAFRGLGCASASASQAFAPAAAAVRSSADWQGKRARRRRGKKKKKERREQVGRDVWCAPGIPFATEASVDCVVAHQPTVGRGRPADAPERIHRERPYISRRVSHQEQVSSFMDSPPNHDTPFFRPDLSPSGHLRHFRGYHRTPGGLEELMMFQTRVLFSGGLDVYDRFQDWRLDVDNMSYEELLELGDKIGYVSTGLREEDIPFCLRKIKHSVFDTSARHLSIETESKCSICQEEYEVSDETGRLGCGHGYHTYCIKQWLLLKNACPVCKTPVLKT